MAEPTAQIEAEIDELLLLQGRSALEDEATPWSPEGPQPDQGTS